MESSLTLRSRAHRSKAHASRMLIRGDWLILASLSLAVGCSRNEAGTEPVQRTELALNASGDVLGFEAASAWHGPGVLGTDARHTEGELSLAVRPLFYSRYDSNA